MKFKLRGDGRIAVCARPGCGRTFAPYRPYQRYCCDSCRARDTKGRPSRYVRTGVRTESCARCGASFETNDAKRRYCSPECRLASLNERRKALEKRSCLVCGATFETTHWSKRYCSKACRETARRRSLEPSAR